MPALDAPPIYELQQQQQQQQIKLQQQKGPVAYSPSALVNYIANEVQIDDQQRPLLSSCTHSLVTFQEPPPPLATDESTNNGNDDDNQEPVDGKENKPPTATTEQQQQQSSRFLCLNCHGVVTIQCSTNQDELRDNCSGAGYPTHHFHKTNNNNHEFECCGCQLIMTFFIQPAPLPVTLLHSLTDDRPVFRTSVMVARNERFPTVIDGLVVLKAYVEGLLKGERRNINANNAHFKARLGLDEAR
ncbi:hypothetical protein BDA99DRAFT_200434 [Phascolomyces articulosus]|uniref:Uncharacterized protein n=1 Tax=Phascolomyces articulosus TaxID=60185 RepID=A0AAD5JRL5_9FUNG|nr:hypothetical protein BDA99DRAFT_200434 [Phascolomyces articulosus]